MTPDEFEIAVNDILDRVTNNLTVKGIEYVPDLDSSRFHNFEVSAAFNGQTEEQALWGFLTKHLVSLSDMVKVDSRCRSTETWDEKIGDAITYLVLLRALVERNTGQPPLTTGLMQDRHNN